MAEVDKPHMAKMGVLFCYFCILAYLLWNYQVGYAILPLLVASAAVWLLYEYSRGVKGAELKAAFSIGHTTQIIDLGGKLKWDPAAERFTIPEAFILTEHMLASFNESYQTCGSCLIK
jgi:hypothetical protein